MALNTFPYTFILWLYSMTVYLRDKKKSRHFQKRIRLTFIMHLPAVNYLLCSHKGKGYWSEVWIPGQRPVNSESLVEGERARWHGTWGTITLEKIRSYWHRFWANKWHFLIWVLSSSSWLQTRVCGEASMGVGRGRYQGLNRGDQVRDKGDLGQGVRGGGGKLSGTVC